MQRENVRLCLRKHESNQRMSHHMWYERSLLYSFPSHFSFLFLSLVSPRFRTRFSPDYVPFFSCCYWLLISLKTLPLPTILFSFMPSSPSSLLNLASSHCYSLLLPPQPTCAAFRGQAQRHILKLLLNRLAHSLKNCCYSRYLLHPSLPPFPRSSRRCWC